MNKLSKTKRDHLILVGLITACAVAGIWFLVIANQKERLLTISAKTSQIQDKVNKAQQVVKLEEETDKKLQLRTQQLLAREETLAPERDAYAWMLEVMNQFVQKRPGLRIKSISQPIIKPDLDLIPKFPFKSAVFNVKGTGGYRDVGKFVADFENGFSYFQIRNLKIEPAGSLATNVRPSEAETLQFELEIVTPIRSSELAGDTK